MSHSSNAPLEERHPSVQQIMRWFGYGHLEAAGTQNVARECHDLAHQMLLEIPDGPELTAGLRKLLEAKDAFVRAYLEAP
jgi:hypothetical protein